VDETKFLGYEFLDSDSKVLVLWKDQNRVESALESEEIFIACDKTPFYGESGGQVGDRGNFSSSESSGIILDCKKQGKVFLHRAKVKSGTLKTGDMIKMNVEKDIRDATAIHHSSTHLMHAALKEVLGDHVQQKGSLVDENKLRFDFSHPKPLSKEEISAVEDLVNRESLNNAEVTTQNMQLEEAMKSGAEALFGEKYEDEVRVLSMGNQSFSVELCGGTHVSRTGDIGTFLITNQSSVASGVRRIEAVGGKVALKHLKETRRINEELQQKLNISAGDMLEKIESLILENKKLKKSGSVKTTETEITFSESYEINDWVLFIQQISIEDNKSLRGMVDARKKTIDKGSIILLNVQDNKIAVVCGVTENIIDQISAKDIVSNICEQINGRGGGRPDFAQGAGETENIKDFVTSIPNSVKSLANS
jgi:alanyl-tRNA synthetase